MDDVFFYKKKVQKLGRIVIDDALLYNAGLQVGDEVAVFFDPNTKRIVIANPEKDERLKHLPDAPGAKAR